MISGVNHLGIAVRDLDASMDLYRRIFRVEHFHRERVEEQKVEIASFRVGGVLLELTAPTSEDSPIAKFLEKRGEGIHHVAFTTDAVSADLERLASEGVQLINTTPQLGAHDMLIAFLHPKSTGGVLMELCEAQKTSKTA
ncbi:MAG: methylmalonyl-CoA epimerase [Candidatus Kapaibacterium sp.]|nr:MAG: methylmalonyl-CoA epimerase [Candidatus Kapabacteria bacterium]